MSKRIFLDNLQKISENLPVQGTDEWLKQRESIIGGSEMKTFKGKDKYKSTLELYKKKIGYYEPKVEVVNPGVNEINQNDDFDDITSMFYNAINISSEYNKTYDNNDLLFPIKEENHDSIVLLQGHLFEDITKHYLEKRYNIYVVNINGPIISKKCNAFGYSMDGVGLLMTSLIKNLPIVQVRISKENYEKLMNDKELLCLFEFKSAYTRTTLPEYDDQIYMGLYTFEEIDICIFVDTYYKMCSIADFYEPRKYSRHLYNHFNQFHKVSKDPIGYSISYLVYNEEVDNDGFHYYGEISSCEVNVVEYILKQFRQNKFTLLNTEIYSYVECNDPNLKKQYISYLNNTIEEMRKKHKIIGYLPWKIYNMNIVLYDRKDNEIEPYTKSAELFANYVNKYKRLSFESKKNSILDIKKELEKLMKKEVI
jgi:hypothetical protein